MTTDEFIDEPGDVLVARRIERPQEQPYEQCVTVDGAVLERSATNARFDGVAWHFDPQPLVWRRLAVLTPPELARIETAISESGFMALQHEYRPPGTSIGGSDVTWTAAVGGSSHTVTLHGVPDVAVGAVEALAAIVERTIGEALDRVSRGG